MSYVHSVSIFLEISSDMHKSTPEQQYQDLVKGQNLSPDDILAVFDKLKPVPPEQFIGSWKGANVNTNHPTEAKLTGMGWAGKDFRSTEDVDPIMVYRDDGSRVWNESWGHARVSFIIYVWVGLS
jgi:hypothetical protein